MREGEYRSNRVIQSPNMGCPSRNHVWAIYVFGSPTGGDFTIPVTVNSVTEDVTLGYNNSNSLTKTAITGHSEIGSNDIDVTGGTFPDSSQVIEFKGDLASTYIDLPSIDYSGLTGGLGVGVFIVVSRLGYPNNA